MTKEVDPMSASVHDPSLGVLPRLSVICTHGVLPNGKLYVVNTGDPAVAD